MVYHRDDFGGFRFYVNLDLNYNHMKAFNITFLVLFIIFAGLQYNDPDPYIWIPLYLLGAYICYAAIQHKFPKPLYLLGFVVYGIYALYLLFDKTGVIDWATEHNAENIVQTMKAEKPWIEETREFGGLVLLLIALTVNWFNIKKDTRVKA